jgi:hypothetical protein
VFGFIPNEFHEPKSPEEKSCPLMLYMADLFMNQQFGLSNENKGITVFE